MTPGGAVPVGRLELGLLAALLLVLPLLEVPKHLLWAAWVLVSLAQAWRSREGAVASRWRPTGWDAILGGFVVAGACAGLGVPGQDWRAGELGDVLRMACVPWLMTRRPYTAEQARIALGAALAGTVLATAHGVWALLAGRTPLLELHSVGHVNHSAIYLAIAGGAALGMLIAASSRRELAGWVAVALLIGVALLVGASRAAVGAFALLMLLLGWLAPVPLPGAQAARLRLRMRLGLLALGGLAIAGYLAAMAMGARQLQPDGQSVVSKFGFQASVGAPVSYRDGLHRVAFAAAGAYPVFGIGLDRFRTLDERRLCAELAPPAPGAPCRVEGYVFRQHAHSLYANTLAEQGGAGLLALLVVLGAWGWRLARTRAWARGSRPAAAVWVASLAGLSVTMAAGLLNTTLHHEHGLLAMTTLGLLLAASARRDPAA